MARILKPYKPNCQRSMEKRKLPQGVQKKPSVQCKRDKVGCSWCKCRYCKVGIVVEKNLSVVKVVKGGR